MNQLSIQPEHGAVIAVPLNKLKASPRNARKTPHAPADIEALAASIAAKDVIQPLVVEPELDPAGEATGFYLVTVGEGRRLALRLRAKRKEIGKNASVRCIVDTVNDAFEVSLDENVTRFAMHPADQFEAFQKLAEDRGFGSEEIAARFGVSATVVRQRMRLALVSPALMARYRAGEMSLDQLMAFTITDDHARQEMAWENLGWNREPHFIRRCLTQDRVRATDRRAAFVGGEAYAEAGGVIERDLFSDDHGGYFADPVLLDRLALEKLGLVADEVSLEGWKWVSASLEPTSAFQMGRVYPRRIDLSPEDQARQAELSTEYDEVCGLYDEDGDPGGALMARLETISAEQAVLDAKSLVFGPDDVARAGVFVTLSSEGEPRIERGLVRKEDQVAQAPSTVEDDDAASDKERERRPTRLPDKLMAELTAHRTAALIDQLGERPELALSVLVHRLATQAFRYAEGSSCLEIRAGGVHLGQHAPGVRETPAGIAIEARHAKWEAELPESGEALWFAILAMDLTRKLALLAHCVAATVNAVEATDRAGRRSEPADRLASALDLDMATYWKPTAEGYLGRVTKPLILEAVREGVSDEAAHRIEGMKKGDMAEAAEGLLADKAWVPSALRTKPSDAGEPMAAAAE